MATPSSSGIVPDDEAELTRTPLALAELRKFVFRGDTFEVVDDVANDAAVLLPKACALAINALLD
jgi:hypothetical protein